MTKARTEPARLAPSVRTRGTSAGRPSIEESSMARAPSSKLYRHGQILKLVRARHLHTQEELAEALRAQGVSATQVTLSRDIRELGLVKTPDGYSQTSQSFGARRPEPSIPSPASFFSMSASLRICWCSALRPDTPTPSPPRSITPIGPKSRALSPATIPSWSSLPSRESRPFSALQIPSSREITELYPSSLPSLPVSRQLVAAALSPIMEP